MEQDSNASFLLEEKPRKAAPLGSILEQYKNEPPTPLITPGIKEVSMGFIFGPPKSGKTIYAENLLQSIAAGRETFNGYPLKCSNKKSLFVSYEENPRGRYDRNNKQMQTFTEQEQELIKENYIISNKDMPKYVLGNREWDILEEEINYYNPGIIALDSLSRLTMESNSEEDTAKDIAKRLRELVIKYGCTIIVINHTTKGSNERAYGVYSMSGSRIYMQEADFMIGINKTIDNTRYIKIVASRYDKDDYDTVDTFTIDDNLCIKMGSKKSEMSILTCFDNRFDSTNTEIVYAEVQKVVETSGTSGFKTGDLKYLVESGQMAKQTFHDALDNLSDSGRIKRLSKGKYQYLTA